MLSGPFDILYVQEPKLIVSTFIMYPVMVTVFSLLLRYQLPSIGMQYIDPQALKLMVVEYLEQNPIINGTHYCELLPEGYELETSNSDRWISFLTELKNGARGGWGGRSHCFTSHL